MTNTESIESLAIEPLRDIAKFVRRDSFEMCETAKSGHIGGSSSSTELLVALYFGGKFNFDPDDPQHPNRDRVLIRGHEGPVRYPIFSLLGYVDREELLTYRQLGSRLQGHEDMHTTPGVDITPSGSLGMLLSYGIGAASALKHEHSTGRTIVFLGDGEEQEGNVSEAARHAATLELDNLICIVDQNKKQLARPTAYTDGNSDLANIWKGYGWDVLEIQDGNNLEEILHVYDQLQSISKPTFVIAKTLKGKGIEGAAEHFNGYHSMSTCDPVLLRRAIEVLNGELNENGAELRVPDIAHTLVVRPQEVGRVVTNRHITVNIQPDPSSRDHLDRSQPFYFNSLAAELNKIPDLPFYVITPDLIRANDAEMFEAFSYYYDTGLREQHTIAMAHGISITNPNARIYINYGDAFAFRALDQINAAAQGGSSMLIAGEYSGLSQGENGRTHQSVSQPGALMQIPELRFYEPADVQDLYNVFNSVFSTNEGLVYVRIHAKKVGVLERDTKDKGNIQCYITHEPDKIPDLIIVGSGLTVESSVWAAKRLELEKDIAVRVINVVNPKDLNDSFVSMLEDGKPVLSVYNGNSRTLQAQVSRAVMEAEGKLPSVVNGHGFDVGTSGNLLDVEKHYQLDAEGIALRALQTLKK
jgi:transketolase